jgi:ectoine hydroxylase-related dioxygenase (phytanoyl-CoA dioxygenase family)
MTTQAQDQLPDLSDAYPVTPEQVAAYQRDGHLLLRGVLSPEEVAVYRRVIRDAAMQYNTETRPLEERDTYGRAFLQIMNLWTRDEGVRQFVWAKRFARIAAQIMGVPGVRLYHDQALFKEPGGGFTPWHQDQTYWPLDTDHTVTMWMPLVDIPPEVGSMTFASGSHRRGWITKEIISDESESFFDRYVREEGLPTVYYGAMSAGDATFHAGWTLHKAFGNPTPNMREVMTVIFMADGVRILAPETKNRENDLASWLPGCKPGDVAASPLNPLLYGAI